MKRPNAAGSDGGAIPPRPPLAHAGARWTTTSTLTPRAFSAATSAFSDAITCWLSWPGAGSVSDHSAHRRTQSAPSRSAVRGIGFVLPERLVDAGLDGPRGGGAGPAGPPPRPAGSGAPSHSKVSAARRRAMRWSARQPRRDDAVSLQPSPGARGPRTASGPVRLAPSPAPGGRRPCAGGRRSPPPSRSCCSSARGRTRACPRGRSGTGRRSGRSVQPCPRRRNALLGVGGEHAEQQPVGAGADVLRHRPSDWRRTSSTSSASWIARTSSAGSA